MSQNEQEKPTDFSKVIVSEETKYQQLCEEFETLRGLFDSLPHHSERDVNSMYAAEYQKLEQSLNEYDDCLSLENPNAQTEHTDTLRRILPRFREFLQKFASSHTMEHHNMYCVTNEIARGVDVLMMFCNKAVELEEKMLEMHSNDSTRLDNWSRKLAFQQDISAESHTAAMEAFGLAEHENYEFEHCIKYFSYLIGIAGIDSGLYTVSKRVGLLQRLVANMQEQIGKFEYSRMTQ